MATSPSDPYKSRVVRGVVQQVRRWLDRGQTTIRRVQVVASWSTQILLYPVYALFQTGRLIGKTFERSQDAAQLRLEAEPERVDIPLTVDAAQVTGEAPILHVLQSLQTLDLPTNCAVQILEAESIRAIASQLDSHDLVLVTNYNQILKLPDPNQQYWLKQRIIYEIAVSNRQQRSRKLPMQRVIRALQGLPTAIRQRFAAKPPLPPLPAPATHELPASLTMDSDADSPIKQSLLVVRNWLSTTEVPIVRMAPAERSLAQFTAAPMTKAKIQIRGVASLLTTRQLVLVSRTNDVLDILTPEQQQFIHQRMTWEVAHLQRYLRLQEATHHLSPLRPPAQHSFLLPPIRAFQRLMTWMQSGPVAMATNLFQEASWLACPLPLPTPARSTSATPQPAQGAIPPAPARQLARRQRTAIRSLQPTTGTAQIAPSPSRSQTQMQPLSDGQLQASGGTAMMVSAEPDLPLRQDGERSREYIDTDVTWIGYEQSWLERVMRWLDRLLLWVEDKVSQLWQGLTRH